MDKSKEIFMVELFVLSIEFFVFKVFDVVDMLFFYFGDMLVFLFFSVIVKGDEVKDKIE